MNNSLQLLLLCSLVIALSLPAQAVEPTILTGTVTHVRDGDTIEVGIDTEPLLGATYLSDM
jgi:hypothetical protein